MKYFTLLFVVFFSFASTSVKAQEIDTDQWAMVSKRTADWCTFCGTWGWQLLEDLIDDNQDKNVILWSTHFSGNLSNPTSEGITTSLGGSGQPLFFVNSDNMGVNSSNVANKRDEINLYINDLLSFGSLAGVGIDATYNDGVLNVNGKAKFFNNIEGGNFYLAYYVVRDHLIAPQTSQGSMADHRYVLIDAVTEGDVFGNNIVSGAIEADAEYTVQASKAIEDIDVENDEIIAILWNQRVDGDFVFFNATRTDIAITNVGTADEIEEISEVNARYNGNEVVVTLELENTLTQVQTRLLNVNGQIMDSKNANGAQGSVVIKYDAANLIPGTYLVQVVVNNNIHTEKVIIQ